MVDIDSARGALPRGYRPGPPLVVGPPGTTVLTSELEQFTQSLRIVRDELAECSLRLGYADGLVTDGELWRTDAPYSAVRAEEAQSVARRAVAEALVSSDVLVEGLRGVVAAYDLTERQLADAHDRLASHLGYGLGWLLPALAVIAAPLLVPNLVGGLVGFLLLPEDRRRLAVERTLALAESKAGLLTDPMTVELVRTVVTSADSWLAGVAHVPSSVVNLLGDDGLDATGIATATAFVGGIAAATGVMREAPVAVKLVTTGREKSAATGVRERIDRIPDGDEQIRIDRYTTTDGRERVEVFIAGTAELGAVTGSQPFDMTSNVTAMAGGSAASARAVEEAMHQAGVTAQAEVVFTGYSQGGLLAAELAASGDWNTVGLVTVGAPAGQVAVPPDIAYLAIEHTDDLVPALGGRFEHSQPLVVRREFAIGVVDTSKRLLPAHELDGYAQTASMVDREPDDRIRSLLARLDSSSGTVTSTTYRAERVLSGVCVPGEG